jgi:hypothetical protein
MISAIELAGFALGAGLVLALATYLLLVATAWLRYGRTRRVAGGSSRDSELDRFMPDYDVVERCRVPIAAPAATAFAGVCDLDLRRSTIVCAIFKARELFMGGKAEEPTQSTGLTSQAKSWGWGLLSEQPGHEIIFGAATQPWLANPIFRGLSPWEFAAFHETGYVKICWNLRVDALDAGHCVASTETRVVTNDAIARAKFRLYWALARPGIVLIRWLGLRVARTEAERLAHSAPKERFA